MSQAAPEPWKMELLSYDFEASRGVVKVRFNPPSRGKLRAEWEFPQLLGVEIVDAVELGPKPLVEEGVEPEVVQREDIVLAIYRPTTSRPVECHARWRIGELIGRPLAGASCWTACGAFDLEVSTLTPGKWQGLAVRTRSILATHNDPPGEIKRVAPLLVLYRPPGVTVSYAEMCHPHDGIGVDIDDGRIIRFHLFGHDLEKGVILRGRLRGIIMPREGDEEEAQRAYAQFLKEPPHLS